MSVTRIQHNLSAMNAMSNYQGNQNKLTGNLEKLSSGYRINSAADDAAGLAISEKMRSQIAGLEKAQDNANDGISLVQTAEGALTEVNSMLTRLKTLATQSANGTYEDGVDRANLQEETNALLEEIDRISQSTNFNGINLLDGSMSNAGLQKTEIAVNINGIAMNASASEKGVSTQAVVELKDHNDIPLDTDQIMKLTYTDEKGESKAGSVVFKSGFDKTGSTKNLAEAINNDAILGSHFKASVNSASQLIIESTVEAAAAINGDSTTGAALISKVEITGTDGTGANAIKLTNADTYSQTTAAISVASNEKLVAADDPNETALDETSLIAALEAGKTINKVTTNPDTPAVSAQAGTDYNVDKSCEYHLGSDKLYRADGTAVSTDDLLTTAISNGDKLYTEANKPQDVGTITAFDEDNVISQATAGSGLQNVTMTSNTGLTLSTGSSVATFEWTATSGWSVTGVAGADYVSAASLSEVYGITAKDTSGNQNYGVGDKFTITSATIAMSKGVEATDADYQTEVKYTFTPTTGTTLYGADAVSDPSAASLNSAHYTNLTTADSDKMTFDLTSTSTLYNKAGDPITSANQELAVAKNELYTIAPSVATITSSDHVGTGSSALGPNIESVTINADAASTLTAGIYTYESDSKWHGPDGTVVDDSKFTVTLKSGATINSSASGAVEDFFVLSDDNLQKIKGTRAVENSDYTLTIKLKNVYTSPLVEGGTTTSTASSGTDYILNETGQMGGTGMVSQGRGNTASKTFDLSSLNDGDRVQINGKNYTFRAKEEDVKSATDFNNATQLASMSDAITAENGDQLDSIKVKDQFASGEALTLQVGDTNKDYQKVDVDIKDMSSTGLGLKGLDISTQENAAKAIDTIQTAVNAVSTQRGKLGALQNRLDHTLNNLDATTQNITAAESQIRDVDMAKEMTQYSKNNILVQAAQSMLAQANSLPQGVLSLLQ